MAYYSRLSGVSSVFYVRL